MKKLITLFILLVCTASGSKAQSGWQWVNPFPTGNNITHVQFVDQNTGYAVSYCDILKTTNAGVNWTLLPTNIETSLGEVSFINAFTGFTCNNEGKILKTTNGGNDWTVHNGGWENYIIRFTSALSGWCTSHSGNSGQIIATTNGGVNWYQQSTPPVYYFLDMDFVSPAAGWAYGPPNLMKTTNGGLNWNSAVTPDGEFWGMDFYSLDTGWLVGVSGKIFKTTNSGNNWVDQISGVSTLLNSVIFYGRDLGFICGHDGVILKTTNGGNDWVQKSSGTNLDLKSICFTSESSGYAVGMFSEILKTTDAGESWSKYLPRPYNNLNSINFYSQSTGWVCGSDGFIQNTTNGGVNWSVQTSSTINPLYSLSSVSSQLAWAAGDYGTIIHTSNGGSVWNSQISNTGEHLSSVFFINSASGWASGKSGTLTKTTNGGDAWTIQDPVTNKNINSVYFVNDMTGYAAGGLPFQFLPGPPFVLPPKQLILKTTNGGTNWSTLIDQNGNELSDIQFISPATGWISFLQSDQQLLKTTDAGMTWSVVLLPYPANSFQFLNENTGWFCSGNGFIAKTTDGGLTWIREKKKTFRALNKILFTSGNEGWVAGEYGTLLKTSTGGSSFNSLGLKVFIEGFYNLSSGSMTSDTVRAYLRNAASPYSIVDSAAALLSSSGTGTFDFINTSASSSYFISVKHRNSIETWSATTITFTGNNALFDFTTGSSQAYGNNMKLTGSAWSVYSGDANQDGYINLNDIMLVHNDMNNFITGYVATDINGDNAVNLNDIIITSNNSSNFVKVIRP